MRRSFLNLAVCQAAFILGTIAAIVFFTPENGDEALSQSLHQYQLKSESPANNASGEKQETESDGSKLVLTETADQSKEVKSESQYPIIEIWQELDGSVPIRGKSLHFRMYDDRVVEFDYVLRKRTYTDGMVEFEYEYRKEPINPPRHTRSVEASLERIPLTKISEEEFSRLKSMSEDFIKSKNIKREYKPVGLTFDVIAKLTILLKENETTERKIIINDSDDYVMDKSLEKKFPESLVNLIKEVHLMRVKLEEKRRIRKNLSFEND